MIVKSNYQLKTFIKKLTSNELKKNPSIGNSLFITVPLGRQKNDCNLIDSIESVSIHLRYTSCMTNNRTSVLIGKSSLYSHDGITIEDAIVEAIRLKKLNKNGFDPKQEIEKERQQNIDKAKDPQTKFRYFAGLYLEKNKPLCITSGKQKQNIGWTQKHYKTQEGRLNNHINPVLGDKVITEISTGDLVRFCDNALKSGQHSWSTVDKFIAIINGAFMEARLDLNFNNPAINLRAYIQSELKVENSHPHINPFKEPTMFGQVISDIYKYTNASFSGILALRLAPHLFLRTYNLISLEWSWVDFKNRLITIPKEFTKNKKVRHSPDLVVPLSKTSLDILKQARSFSGDQKFVFPSNVTSNAISDNCLRKSYNKLGHKEAQSLHGFRHSAKTWLKENGFSSEATELQLHHIRSKIEETYDGSELLEERRKMMQAWSDFLDSCKN